MNVGLSATVVLSPPPPVLCMAVVVVRVVGEAGTQSCNAITQFWYTYKVVVVHSNLELRKERQRERDR